MSTDLAATAAAGSASAAAAAGGSASSAAAGSSASSVFSKGTLNTADFEMTAQASLKVFQGVEYSAAAPLQTTEDIAAAFHGRPGGGSGAAALSKNLKSNLVGGAAAAGVPRERKSR